jgi:hypothetical protein
VSLDHADLAICDQEYLDKRPELERLVRGMPHALILTNSNDEPQASVQVRMTGLLDDLFRSACQSAPPDRLAKHHPHQS